MILTQPIFIHNLGILQNIKTYGPKKTIKKLNNIFYKKPKSTNFIIKIPSTIH